jgi:6-phosphofructokinase 1
MFTNIAVFLVVLGVLVFVHEMGHFIAAKMCGVYVDRFSLGMPPRIFGIRLGGTDYCIGFDTAVRNAVSSIDMIRDTASSHERVFAVEVMGKKRGFIALQVGLATGAELILIPEEPFPLSKIPGEIERAKSLGKLHFIMVISEGYGKAHEIQRFLLSEIGEKYGEIRATVLGHIQRGGSPTHFDRIMGMKFGEVAVEALASGENSGFVAYRRGRFYLEDFKKAGEYKEIDREALRLSILLNS